ncbi:calcium/sodium antiporter [Candidatus Peregrinibacteria bacterium]|nr:calcium/sodium antiporter [Candidatus Peregrinibacteria bacterium]
MLTYTLFVIGFIFLIKGADYLVDGSSSLASRAGISQLVIGLTIVSFGTSAPELLVNIVASLKGASDIGIGNILGSNIANIFLILGVAAAIYPLRIQKSTTWKEIPLNFLSAIVLLVLANDIFLDGAETSILSHIDGLILMFFFIIFVYYTVGLAKAEKNHTDGYKKYGIPRSIIMILVGIVGLAYGGKWVVDGAVDVASRFGVSEALIGLTIVAVGTSLPELATSAVAAMKRNADIAIGNVVGSNLFNVFWVLGLSAVIKPLPFRPEINTDILVYLVATILLFLFAFTGKKEHVSRVDGWIFLSCYAAYIVFLVYRG